MNKTVSLVISVSVGIPPSANSREGQIEENNIHYGLLTNSKVLFQWGKKKKPLNCQNRCPGDLETLSKREAYLVQ